MRARPERPLLDVLLEAGAIRFKPILLTALAAMIGAAVILADPIFQGLAISLLFGLASSTAAHRAGHPGDLRRAARRRANRRQNRERMDGTTACILTGRDFTDRLRQPLRELRAGSPEVMKGFSAIAQAALKADALDAKTKELIALGISVAIRCDDCIAFHAKAAVERGATREEVLETLGMAIYMGAGPSAMYASHAIEAFDQLFEASTGADRDSPTMGG